MDFVDGSVERKFTISTNSATGNGTAARTTNATTNRTANATTNRTANGSPRTGDTSNWALWIGLIAVSVIAIAAIFFVRKRGKKDEAAVTAEADNKADEAGNGRAVPRTGCRFEQTSKTALEATGMTIKREPAIGRLMSCKL